MCACVFERRQGWRLRGDSGQDMEVLGHLLGYLLHISDEFGFGLKEDKGHTSVLPDNAASMRA